MRKNDVWGICMSLGVGIVTGLIYFAGKLAGKSEAYGDCADMLREAVETCNESEE